MAQTNRNRRRLAVALVATPLILGAVGLTALRAPGATVEGYGSTLGISGEAPGRDFAAALKNFPVKIGGESFTASELGVTAEKIPTVPRAWSFGDWNRDYDVVLKGSSDRQDAALSKIKGSNAPVDATVSYDGSWKATPSQSGVRLAADLPAELTKAIDSGKKSLELSLEDTDPQLSTEVAQQAADKLNAASVGVYGGSTELARLDSAEVAQLITVEADGDHFVAKPKAEAVKEVAAGYATSLKKDRVDGEEITDDSGKALKIITPSQSGFTPGSADEIAAKLSESLSGVLDSSEIKVEVPGKADAAKPKTLNRTAIVDKSDHYSYFYENGKEVKRIPSAIGKAGHDTKNGTFKVYAQLTSQNMGSCTASGAFRPGGSFDYCTANVPYVSYFNGDQGFHGAYWHNNFGNPSSNMSHGCVNLPVADSQWVYSFLQVGSTVTVRD